VPWGQALRVTINLLLLLFSKLMRSVIFFVLFGQCVCEVDPSLMHSVYTDTFRLRDGSVLTAIESTCVSSMRDSLGKLVASNNNNSVVAQARTLPDDRLLKILMLAVAGNFTVDQGASALPQKCGIVVDPGTGALVLKDRSEAQSVILEVLLIISILCLLRAWGVPTTETH